MRGIRSFMSWNMGVASRILVLISCVYCSKEFDDKSSGFTPERISVAQNMIPPKAKLTPMLLIRKHVINNYRPVVCVHPSVGMRCSSDRHRYRCFKIREGVDTVSIWFHEIVI